MKCPHCNKPIVIPKNALIYVETYGRTSITRVDCCGKGVWLRRIITFEATPAKLPNPVDAWGRPFSN